MSKSDLSQNSLSRSIQYAIHRSDLSNKTIEQTEGLKRVNEEHGGFSYTLSHDLKAPLRTIVGFFEIILKNNLRTFPSSCYPLKVSRKIY